MKIILFGILTVLVILVLNINYGGFRYGEYVVVKSGFYEGYKFKVTGRFFIILKLEQNLAFGSVIEPFYNIKKDDF